MQHDDGPRSSTSTRDRAAPAPQPDPGLPARLVADVTGAGALVHLIELQRIAEANGGNRALGTPGYDASVEYVAGVLRDAGYDVQTPGFTIRQFSAQEQRLTVDGGPVDVTALGYSPATPAGGVTGPLAVMAGEGCAPADAATVTPGSVALVRRGTCTFAQKVAGAVAAGAAAVIVINTDDVPLADGSLGEQTTGAVPTGGVSRSAGDALAGRAGASVTLTLATTVQETQSRNVLAQTRTGDPGEVVVAGGHLDSVPEGPGINDNGSGTAALLETAVRLGGAPPVTNAVRFAFWGAEEVGLVGSSRYVQGLSEDERARIALYLNLDMVASPNTSYMVYDGDDSDREGAGAGPPGSAAVERALDRGPRRRRGDGLEHGLHAAAPTTARSSRPESPPAGCSPGRESRRHPSTHMLHGGTAGQPYDAVLPPGLRPGRRRSTAPLSTATATRWPRPWPGSRCRRRSSRAAEHTPAGQRAGRSAG